MSSGSYKIPLVIIVVIIASFAVYKVLTIQDNRSVTDKIGDAVHALPDGPDKAARQLEDRTPGQKLGDAVKDTGDKIKKQHNP